MPARLLSIRTVGGQSGKTQENEVWSLHVAKKKLAACVFYIFLVFSNAHRVLSRCNIRGSPIGFLGSGIWLISRPGFGILKVVGTRFGIVIMTGTRDLAILTGGNRECRFKETEIREFQRLKYEKKI